MYLPSELIATDDPNLLKISPLGSVNFCIFSYDPQLNSKTTKAPAIG